MSSRCCCVTTQLRIANSIVFKNSVYHIPFLNHDLQSFSSFLHQECCLSTSADVHDGEHSASGQCLLYHLHGERSGLHATVPPGQRVYLPRSTAPTLQLCTQRASLRSARGKPHGLFTRGLTHPPSLPHPPLTPEYYTRPPSEAHLTNQRKGRGAPKLCGHQAK